MEQQVSDTSLGQLTYTNLSGTDVFDALPAKDGWDVLRQPFSPRLARMSAEMAANSYELDIKGWQSAGWDDCSFVVEDKVIHLDGDGESRIAMLEKEWKRRRARSMIQGVKPVSDLRNGIRQILVTDMGKGMVMTRQTVGGRSVIAIAFVGTTDKYYDWFANFKFQHDEGLHHGFLSLARQFEAQTARVLLPKLAAARGEDTYTLADAILDAGRPDSGILFWLCGHSQGGAIVQTFAHLLLEKGVPAQNIIGYTFAAPTVAMGKYPGDPKVFPIYNIVNTDDLVTRVGAQMRLGVDWVYRPDDAFRKQYYGVQEGKWEIFARAHQLAMQVQTTQQAIYWAIALIRLLRDMDTDAEMKSFFAELVPRLSILRRINVGADDIAAFVEGKLIAQSTGLAQEMPDSALIDGYEGDLRDFLRDVGAKECASALRLAIAAAHHMCVKTENVDAPYIAIVRRYLWACRPGVWSAGDSPRCISETDERLLPLSTERPGWLQEAYMPLLQAPDGEFENSETKPEAEEGQEE